ncbi:DUF2927 domain-containing protein [Rhodospirillales bacterium]|nr:DUF2927 domain-containing protein [Rhodospirillales bacterium]
MIILRTFLPTLVIGFVLLVWNGAVAEGSANEAHPIDLGAFFEDVALGSKSTGRIIKWTKAPIVRLEVIAPADGNYNASMRIETPLSDYEFVARHIEQLRKLTSLPIRLLPRDIGEGGDIVVTITPWHLAKSTGVAAAPDRLLRRLMGPGRCFFVLWPTSENGIKKAHIIINSKLDEDHIRHCYLEEITQSMGLPYDSDRVRPSIFNEASRERSLSKSDFILIRTLYDPRIRSGMDRTTAKTWASSIIEKEIMRAD